MHTARQLDRSLFQISIDGQDATREDVLGEWGPLDRFGLLVHEPFGSIGASYLLQLAITAFYDARPDRRSHERPIYPDVFVFHVGGKFGDHTYFDVYPPRKEVFVGDDPAAVLEAINDRGVTHLAVPDGPTASLRHAWKEPAQALDRLAATWAYDPSGRARGADVEITAASPRAEANAKIALHSSESYHERQQARAALGDITIPDDEFLASLPDREAEVSQKDRDRIRDERATLLGEEGRTESYRRITTTEALSMLARDRVSAPRPA